MSNQKQISGVFTALITPMKGEEILWDVLRQHVESQIKSGINGLVPVGTTGESPTLNTEEHIRVIEVVAEVSNGRVPVFAGTGANSTSEALHLTAEADKVGADGFLQVAPYYNKPSQEGLYQHFARIAESTEKPIMLYSIPGRCGIAIGVDTVARLVDNFPNVRTIKEAGGDVERVTQLKHACGDKLTVLSGDDGLVIPFVAAGADGVVSVASNLRPEIIIKLTQAALSGDMKEANRIAHANRGLVTDLVFLDGNPVSIKEAMFRDGQIPTPDMRLPLVRMSEQNQEIIEKVLKETAPQ